jgi:hypothetical protein
MEPHLSTEFDRIRGEVNSRCASLRSASRLLEGLSKAESDEMLALMTAEARQLARSLAALRRHSTYRKE